MTDAELHLLLNQVPIFGVALGICGMVYGILKKDKKYTYGSLFLYTFLALITIPVSISGMEAADTAKLLADINYDSLDSHSRIAYVTFSLMYALGILSVITFFIIRKDKSYRLFLPITVLCLSVIVFTLMTITGSIGSGIRNNDQIKKSNVFQPYENTIIE
jgi:uncharacterized membrane protein